MKDLGQVTFIKPKTNRNTSSEDQAKYHGGAKSCS
jgi:hypothetical protein